MKKLFGIMVLGLILFVVQPANVLKADLASDILKKTQELASSKEPLVFDAYEFGKVTKYYSINLFDKHAFDQNLYRFECKTKRPSDPDQLYYTKHYLLINDKHNFLSAKYQRSDRKYLEDGTRVNKVTILEAKGTVITFYYGNTAIYKYVYQIDYGDKTKFTIDLIKPTFKTGRLCVRDKRWDDAKKFFNEHHQGELTKKQKLEAKRQKEYETEQAYNNSPEGQLHNTYLSYMVIKGYYEARKGYEVVYLTSKQMLDAKSKVKEIEDTIVAENNIDSDTIWNKSVKTYEDKEKRWMDALISSGSYTKGNSQLAKRQLYFVTVIHNNVTGGTKIEKDF